MRAERAEPQDWEDWRALRVEALRDYPLGFLRTYEDAVAQSDDDWRAWLSRPGAFWLVRDGGRPVAMCSAWEDGGQHWLGAVYVTPASRGAGLLEELVSAAAAWVREQGAAALHLEVHEDNVRAQRAYARLGFAHTGGRSPYPLPPGGDELEMALPL